MGREKNNIGKFHKTNRFAPPKFSNGWIKLTLPVLVIVWVFCYTATGIFAGYIHNREAEAFTQDSFLYQYMFNQLNSRYSASKQESGASSMSYANYQKEVQFYLRYSGVATVLYAGPEAEGPCLDASEEKMFLSIEWPDGRTDALLSCDAKMEEAYYDLVEKCKNSDGRLQFRMQEVYVNWETWEFIPRKMYLSISPEGLDSDSSFYENSQSVGEGFELVTVAEAERFWVFYPGTWRNRKTDDQKMQDWYDARVASLDYLESIGSAGDPAWAVTSYVSPKPWIFSNLWYYVGNLFRDSRLENTIPVMLYDQDGNLEQYSLQQAHQYSLSRMYGRQIVWNWLGVTLLCLVVCSLLSYLIYGKKRSRYERESYRRNLTNTMAHDLKSPLMAISGYAENLKEKVHPEKEDYYTDAIMDCVAYMNGIVADMLDLGRLEQAEISLHREEVSVEKFFAELAAYYQDRMDAKKIRFSTSGTCVVNADAKMLKRAFDNLFNNAVRYTPEGNEIKALLQPGKIVLTNTGVSLTEEMRERAFEPFVKEDRARSDRRGSGLGLAIAKQIFDAHGMSCRMECDGNSVSLIVEWNNKKGA